MSYQKDKTLISMLSHAFLGRGGFIRGSVEIRTDRQIKKSAEVKIKARSQIMIKGNVQIGVNSNIL